MFLRKEQNEKLVQVGPGTPGGELLRRYWHPIGGLHEVTDQTPTKFVRLLGEDLVLFRDRGGHVGLLADHCSHRGASLLYGRIEERGIACAYHGWLYDVEGNCLETPAEPPESLFRLTVKHRAYPVEKLFGLYWAYLGPAPAPPIRRLDVMEYEIKHVMETEFAVSWVQVVENNIDGSHIGILHQDTSGNRSRVTSTTRGQADDLKSLDYWEFPFGIMRKLVTADGYVEEDPLIFPNMLRRMTELSIKVPTDDTHTRKFVVFVEMARNGNGAEPEAPDYYVFPMDQGKSVPQAVYPDTAYRMDDLRYQDQMAIESQGRVSARENWHPGTADRGVALFDELLLREMDRVREGHDALGVVRDPDLVIDTNFAVLEHVGHNLRGPQGVLVHSRRQPTPVL